MGRLASLLRIFGGLICVGVLVLAMLPPLIVLIPWRVGRIHVTNYFGTLIGMTVMWWSGSTVTIEGREDIPLDSPAIYATNHTSIFDAFTTIWLTPPGTVGVAKKEVFFYPFYGQAWWLAGHVFLDRGQTENAKRNIKKASEFVRNNGLSICILPEGTRSVSGRLLPFKKGIAHVAMATGLPIVPMVTIGATRAWTKSSLTLNPCDIRIIFRPPISTAHWTEDTLEQAIEELRAPFLETLPEDQLPLPLGETHRQRQTA